MINILMVPIKIDALFLEERQSVLPQMLDFTQLPYYENGTAKNAGTPYLSESIATKPFQNANLSLEKGIHLHWAIPDALSRGVVQADNTVDLPIVPNRWLITRCIKTNGEYVNEKQWVVESDKLFIPDNSKDYTAKNSILYDDQKTPFRYMGNAQNFSEWNSDDNTGPYFDKLTSIGYGDPIFGAFYPHCRSVFGFFDEDNVLTQTNLPNYQFQILGWYSSEDNDFCAKLITNLTKQKPDFSNNDFLNFLQEEANWTIEPKDGDSLPQLMVAYAQLDFSESTGGDNLPETPDFDISIGNTPLEALSAYCATKTAPDNKAGVEHYLEAVNLAKKLRQHIIDTGYKFEQERHTSGFIASASEHRWIVKVQSTNTQVADAMNDQLPEDAGILPDNLIELLDTLNSQQSNYDKTNSEIISLRQQLFYAWYKYQYCVHPDPSTGSNCNSNDAMNYLTFISNKINDLNNNNGKLSLTFDPDNHNVTKAVGDGNGSGSSAADQLAETISIVLLNIKPLQQEKNYTTLLYQEPAARYWSPRSPSIILAGPDAKPSLRHGQNGWGQDGNPLICQICSIDGDIVNNFDTILSMLPTIQSAEPDNFAFATWETQPWNPFILQWEASFSPFIQELDSKSSNYDEDFITDNFKLDQDLPTLTYKGDPKSFISNTSFSTYTGYCILTPHAGSLLSSEMDLYLMQQLLDVYCDAQNPSVPFDLRTPMYFKNNRSEIIQWYKDQKTDDSPQIEAIYESFELLTNSSFGCLSQVLGGFNPALIMQKQTYQLNIADPMQSPLNDTANIIKQVVGTNNQKAPIPENMFYPLRAGGFNLNKLRLVDTFGRYKDLDNNQITNFIFSESLSLSGLDTAAYLPPRITQPAKLNSLLLSANSDSMPMNSHIGTSPVCGWILTNNLDHSIMVYDNQGNALGSLYLLNETIKWQQAPQSDIPVDTVDKISNSHLKKMVNFIISADNDVNQSDFFNKFFTALEIAVESIAPDNYAEHQSLALMVGRPLALVRISLKFELQGLAATSLDWTTFETNAQHAPYDDNPFVMQKYNFTSVNFPIRVGEHQRLGDGVIGYWQETDDNNYVDQTYFTVQDDTISQNHIKSNKENTSLKAAFDSPTIYLSMLVDPRAKIHITTGVLPVKSMLIPSKYYSPALNSIEVTFLTAPILSDSGRISLPLSLDSDYSWVWLSKSEGHWNCLNYVTSADEVGLSISDSTPVLPNDTRLYEGWLKISRNKENN